MKSTDLFGTSGERQLTWDAIDKFFAAQDAPAAVCCGNDRLAIAVYSILRGRGISVPDEVSVVGYDDHRLISETLYPGLTTAELPYSAMGARAAQVLLGLLSSESPPPVRHHPRRRTGPAPRVPRDTARRITPQRHKSLREE